MAVPVQRDDGGGGAGNAADAVAVREHLKALFEAVHSGDVQRFTTTARAGAGPLSEAVAVRDAHGRSVLHHAARLGHLQLAQYMVSELGAQVNSQDETGETPLTLAAGAGKGPMVHFLLERGAEVDLRMETTGAAAVHRAAAGPSAEVLDALLDAGADANMGSATGPPLCWAAGSGQAACVECLLGRGADPNSMTPEEVSPLLMAAAAGCVDIVAALLAHGANPNQVCQDGATALLAAAAFPDSATGLQIVTALLKAGADANLADDGGATALLAAGAEGHLAIVELLLPHSAPIEGVEWAVAAVAAHAREKYGADEPMGSGQGDEAGGSGGEGPVSVPDAEEPDEAAALAEKRLGDEAFVRGDFAAADAAYSQSLRHNTGNHLVWANRSAAVLKLGRAPAALQDARISRTIQATYAKAWFREGSAHAAMLNWEDAAHAFFAACRADPNNNELVVAFQDAIAQGKVQHAAKQAAASR